MQDASKGFSEILIQAIFAMRKEWEIPIYKEEIRKQKTRKPGKGGCKK